MKIKLYSPVLNESTNEYSKLLTEQEESLLYIVNGVNRLGDFIGNTGAFNDGQFEYDENHDYYLCTQDTFEWWSKVINDHLELEESINKFCTSTTRELCLRKIEKENGNVDLEDYAAAIIYGMDKVTYHDQLVEEIIEKMHHHNISLELLQYQDSSVCSYATVKVELDKCWKDDPKIFVDYDFKKEFRLDYSLGFFHSVDISPYYMINYQKAMLVLHNEILNFYIKINAY